MQGYIITKINQWDSFSFRIIQNLNTTSAVYLLTALELFGREMITAYLKLIEGHVTRYTLKAGFPQIK